MFKLSFRILTILFSPVYSLRMRILYSPLIDKVWTTESHYIEALTLFKSRQDKSYSLCDAVSFMLMREHGLDKALTTDRHFEQEGFVRLLK